MSPGIGKCQKIRHIVRIRQMLKHWRRKAHFSAAAADVPPGHVAVCVGMDRKRYVVRATVLNHPILRRLLHDAAEEYGFSTAAGPLEIPSCDESLFEEILRVVASTRPESGSFGLSSSSSSSSLTLEDIRRCCHVGLTKNLELYGESRPLLPALTK